MIAINVDLYNDGDADTRGLQSRLTSYFNLITTTPVVAANGDEPQAIGVSNTGKYVYVVNGGFDQFVTASSIVIPIPGVIDAPPPVDPGVTVLSARGVTDVFAAATLTQPPTGAWQYPSTEMFPISAAGWHTVLRAIRIAGCYEHGYATPKPGRSSSNSYATSATAFY